MALDCTFANSVGDHLCRSVAPFFDKPARDLKEGEALGILTYLQSQGKMPLYDPTKTKGFKNGHVRVATKFNDVEFWHASGSNGSSRLGSVGATWSSSDFFDPSPAFAVVLYRFAARLRDRWGATKIVWGGVGLGSGKNPVDCHMTGHCVDFYGATTTRGGVFDVKRDWYLRPVFLANGKEHATADKSWDRDRWGTDRHTSYRLLINKDAEEKLPEDKEYYNPRARDFFVDVYQFISEECAFGPGDIAPAAFRAGSQLKAGYTMHPDYPTGMRVSHNDHIHFQLGEAFK